MTHPSLDDVRSAVELIKNFARAANPPDSECSEAMELLVLVAQLHLEAEQHEKLKHALKESLGIYDIEERINRLEP